MNKWQQIWAKRKPINNKLSLETLIKLDGYDGGAGTINHIDDVVRKAGASAVALGSMVVFQKKGMGILVNFPNREQLTKTLS